MFVVLCGRCVFGVCVVFVVRGCFLFQLGCLSVGWVSWWAVLVLCVV